jgi:hypothetical protein
MGAVFLVAHPRLPTTGVSRNDECGREAGLLAVLRYLKIEHAAVFDVPVYAQPAGSGRFSGGHVLGKPPPRARYCRRHD